MERKLPSKYWSRITREKLCTNKQYWNYELSTLWKTMRDKEKLFLKVKTKTTPQI